MSDRQMDSATTGDGGAAAIVSGLLLAVLVVFGLFYFFSFHADTNAIDIQPPRIAADGNAAGQ